MKIEIYPIDESFLMLRECIRHCWGREVKSVDRLYSTHDSTMEIPEFYIIATVPRSVAMHMETHKKKHGCYVWLSSARPDRDEEASKNYSRSQAVKMVMKVTARGLVDISHYRMCMKTEEPTRKFMDMVKEELARQGFGALADQMMRLCEYRNGICSEVLSCKTQKKSK